MATLELRNVNKTYGAGLPDTLKNIELSIKEGEFLILVGPSGCGKSTLMNCIAGLETITGGAIMIGDQDVSGMSPKDRDIAMVFQSYALYPTMSVRENIEFGLKIRKMPQADIDAEVARVAKLLQIEHLLNRKPGQLSGGQQQRVAMGRALARRPKIYLFDEPLSNLDAKLRAGMRAEIARLHARLGTTMIYVTHDQIEAMTLGQRIVVLKDGRIQQIDTPMAMYERPANLFVATFLGSPAMNVIEGRLRRADGLVLETGEGLRVRLDGADVPDAWLDRGIALGVRPEHLLPVEGDAVALSPQVETVEPVGSEVFVNLRLGDMPLVARLPPDHIPREGDALPLALRVDRLHFFDPASGQRLPA